MDTPELAYTWTASSTSARDATRAFFGWFTDRPRFWVFMVVTWLAMSAWLFVGYGDDVSTASKAIWSPIFALIMVLVIFGFFLALVYVQTVRRMKLRLKEGNVLESGFGEGVVRVRGPLSDSVLTAAGIDSVIESGDWVLVRQRGVPLIGVWPRTLFPDAEFERLRQAVHEPR